jgi:hypothetical protein
MRVRERSQRTPEKNLKIPGGERLRKILFDDDSI